MISRRDYLKLLLATGALTANTASTKLSGGRYQ